MFSIAYTSKIKENKSAQQNVLSWQRMFTDEQTLFSNTTTNIELEGLTSTYLWLSIFYVRRGKTGVSPKKHIIFHSWNLDGIPKQKIFFAL